MLLKINIAWNRHCEWFARPSLIRLRFCLFISCFICSNYRPSISLSPTLFDCLPVCNYVLKLSLIKIDNFNWNKFALKRSKFLDLPTVFGWNVVIHGNVHSSDFCMQLWKVNIATNFYYIWLLKKFRREILAEFYSYAINSRLIFSKSSMKYELE